MVRSTVRPDGVLAADPFSAGRIQHNGQKTHMQLSCKRTMGTKPTKRTVVRWDWVGKWKNRNERKNRKITHQPNLEPTAATVTRSAGRDRLSYLGSSFTLAVMRPVLSCNRPQPSLQRKNSLPSRAGLIVAFAPTSTARVNW